MSRNPSLSRQMMHFKPYYVYRMVKWKLGDRSPIGLDLKLTPRCNLSCVHCAWRQWEAPELPTEEWFRLMDDAREMGCRLAMFEGGEPTLREDLNELVEYAKKTGYLTAIFTNGTNPLDVYDPDAFWVSIDNVGEKNDRIRGKGAFEMTMRNIERSKRRNIVTWTTVSRLNMNDLEAICRRLSGHVAGMIFSFFYPYKNVEDISLTREERVAVGKRLLALKSKYPNMINSDTFFKTLGEDYPTCPWAAVTISPDGKIHQGCPIEHIEDGYDCSKCYMVCCREPALIYQMRLDAIQAELSILNMESSNLFWIKRKL